MGRTNRTLTIGALEKFLSQWDAWLLPVSAIPAFPHWHRGRRFPVDGQAANYLMGTVGTPKGFHHLKNTRLMDPLV